ncbi:carboxyltransferase domain-containing protein [Neopusillimonas aromaticivorans]|nr:carboxyltransferase domain-containing protein [Neopusillimonas aromaticivorans]WJJ93224.1 carboxyltransferase domain-containing protein [Neopusillimonas aromaticivorans]
MRYDSLRIRQADLVDRLLALESRLPDVTTVQVSTRVVHLPVAWEDSATLAAVQRYQETVKSSAPWLPNNVDFIQRINGLETRDEVRRIFFDTRYLVMGLGDVYLGAPCAVPLDPRHRLLTSKYNPARTFTAEGTVGIGGVYMCIYGMDSPGGYQLVGRTVPIWNKFLKNPVFHQGQPWLLRFFDQVRFYPVSEAELARFRDDFREGRAVVRIEEEVFDYAVYQQFLQDNADSIAQFRSRQAQAFEQEVARWQVDDVVDQPAPVADVPEIALARGQQLVEADLSGNIWKVLVEPGQAVAQGDTLLIVEAMKMEVHITAPQAGRVERIVCVSGRPVNAGDPLLVLAA